MKINWTIHICLLLGCVTGIFTTQDNGCATSPPRVHINHLGDVIGDYETLWYNRRSVEVFRGIPFAESPVNARRFAKTVPLRRLPSNPYVATMYPPACLQIYSNVSQSEDCLYLNIWRPCTKRRAGRRVPVVVFIYGGAFVVGHTQNPNYNGLPLSALDNLIVVNFNYRLGPFGFADLSDIHPDLGGNQGWDDQRLALIWVKRHIADFGGDSRKITVMGCSAGSLSTSYHLTSPFSNRLFSRAVMDAGALSSHRFETSRSSFQRTLKLAVRAGCTDREPTQLLNCLRSIPSTKLRDLSLTVMDSPLLGFRPTAVTDLEAAPKDVSVLLGHSGNEGLTLVSNGFGINDPLPHLTNIDEATDCMHALIHAAFPYAQNQINTSWPILKEQLIQLYFVDQPSQPSVLVDRAATFVGDLFFHCTMLDFYSHLSNATFYVFNRTFHRNVDWDVNPSVYKSFHMTAHMHFMGAQLMTLREHIHPDDLEFTLKSLRWLKQFAGFGRVKEFPRTKYPQIVLISDEMIELKNSHEALHRCSALHKLWKVIEVK